MAHVKTGKSLKRMKPRWFCIANHYGSVSELAASGVRLQYVTDPKGIANVWRYLGNPKFRFDYAYLLVSVNPETAYIEDVYAVRLPDDVVVKRRNLLSGDFKAFEGHVDKICYGWGSPQRVRSLIEGTTSCTGAVPPLETDEL
jgi:hypothetical protein